MKRFRQNHNYLHFWASKCIRFSFAIALWPLLSHSKRLRKQVLVARQQNFSISLLLEILLERKAHEKHILSTFLSASYEPFHFCFLDESWFSPSFPCVADVRQKLSRNPRCGKMCPSLGFVWSMPWPRRPGRLEMKAITPFRKFLE